MCFYYTSVSYATGRKCVSYNPHHSRQSAGSSDRSPQSSSVSHFHQNGIHLSFLQTNWWEMWRIYFKWETVRVSGKFKVLIWVSPGWRCSWTCTASHQRPGRSLWDRHIYNLRPERADTSYCSRHCLSGTGDLWLQQETRERYIRPITPTISRQIK